MKLVHQINLAFVISLLLVLSVTAVVIHYVLMDHFIGTQKEDMRMIGLEMSATMEKEATLAMPSGSGIAAFSTIISPSYAGIEAVLTDEEGNIVSQTLSSSIAMTSTADDVGLVIVDSPTSLQKIQEGMDSRYIAEVSTIPQGKLTLITPVDRIKEIEQVLLGRLLIVFFIGGIFMLILSLFITRKLIKPLMKLKEELKKVEGRQFSEVKLVKAKGEIGSVAQTVYEMAGELKKFNHVQKQFFQNASHELKTPLMSISGYAEGIRDGVFEGDSIRTGLDVILSESGRMKNIVTEMTLLAKLDSEENIFRPSNVRLKDLIDETIERINPLLTKNGLTLHTNYNTDEPMIIHADRDKLLQALLNVVSNAIRYAKKNIYIHAVINEDSIELKISDDGPGIAADLLPYLFHRFVKGKDGESGLGLAISRAIVERSGGLITAQNGEDGGAIISLGFPAVS